MKYKIFLLTFFFIALFVLEAKGDIIKLKSGRTMSGTIKNETEEGVELDVGTGTVKFRWEAIKRIHKAIPVEIGQEKQKKTKKEVEEIGIGGYQKKLLKHNPRVKQLVTRGILSREILNSLIGELQPYSLEKSSKLSLEKTIRWWARHILMIILLVVGLFVLLSVTFNARLGKRTRIIVTLVVIIWAHYLIVLITNSLKFISISYK